MHRALARSLAVVVLLIACASQAHSDPQIDGHVQVRQIPFSTWLNAQPTTVFSLIGRVSSVPFSALTNDGLVDYTGKIASAAGLSYGFTAAGTIQLVTNPDGTGQVRLNEDFSNALSWVRNQASGLLVFGYTATELGKGTGTPGLASGHMQVVYTVPDASDPELNLYNVLFGTGETLLALKFNSVALGPLRSGFGLPDGTPGKCIEACTGLFDTSGGGATADGFPAEHVDVFATSAARGAALSGPSRPNSAGTWGALRALYR